MSGCAAILGLGARGARWAETCLAAGWEVRGFDPDDRSGLGLADGAAFRRETTISAVVRNADWVICCLPERLELMRTVIQRAQAAASESAVIAVVSSAYDADTIQTCAIRPGRVFRIQNAPSGDASMEVTGQNDAEMRHSVAETLAIFSAASCARTIAHPESFPERREA